MIFSVPAPRLLVTRPELAASETAAALRAVGYQVLVSPALIATAIKPRDLILPKQTTLIVTSPQAARFLKTWQTLHTYKVLAVGTQTAALLKSAGFTRVIDAGGDAAAILKLTAQQRPQTYRLLGAPSTGRSLEAALQAQGHTAKRVLIYRIEPAQQLNADAKTAFARGGITHVLFYSARTAQSFLALVPTINLKPVTALCISETVVKAARAGHFGKVLVAAHPTAEALQRLLPALD